MGEKQHIGGNPVTGLDYPDPDVIRVGDTYYMVSTTMHFMPGCEILRSYDLLHWEHAAYVYHRLDSTQGQMLGEGKHIYGKGMWAASLRYHKGIFHICFVANDTGRTYLYRAKDIQGPWQKSYIEGFYHDCSLLFDDDDRIYLAYGNREIYITELKPDMSGPLEGGLHRLAVKDCEQTGLGYEGTHFYKIKGSYYLFFIHSLPDRWRRVEACYKADSLQGIFEGQDVLNDDMGYCNQGVAQGGIVDTPEGNWYAMLFQDRGAVGRIPVLLPVTWQEKFPIFGENGHIPEHFPIVSTRPEYRYTPLVQSDDFHRGSIGETQHYGCFGLKSCWQFNHEPDLTYVHLDTEKGEWMLETDRLCSGVTQARNTLTQRMQYPECEAEVSVNGRELREGDYAGLCALQGTYGMIALTRRDGKLMVVMKCRNREKAEEIECEAVAVSEESVRFKLAADFTNMRDEAVFYYLQNGVWKTLGVPHKLYFGLDHFTGCRFGLFMYATKETGGRAVFKDFVYRNEK